MLLLLHSLSILCFMIDATWGGNTSGDYQKRGVDVVWNDSKYHKPTGKSCTIKDVFETARDELKWPTLGSKDGTERNRPSLCNIKKDRSEHEREVQNEDTKVHEYMKRKAKRSTRSHKGLKSRLEVERYYKHLGTLISDFANSMKSTSLTLYTRQTTDKRLLQFISGDNALTWNIQPCFQPTGGLGSSRGKSRNQSIPFGSEGESPSSRNGGEKISLMVTLCDEEGAEATLLEMVDHLPQNVWLLAGFEYDGIWSPDVYIPIDSMVVAVKERTPGVFLLTEIWFPARHLPMKQNYLATWRVATAGEGIDSLAGNIGHLNRTFSQATKASDRLSFTTSMKYDRRMDLTGIHFIVTSVNDSRAHFQTFDSLQNREILSGFFGNVWETLRNQLNFTYTLRTPDDGEFGRISNGSWTGLVSDVLNKRADIIVAFFSRTHERAQVIDYSSNLLKFSYRIFARPSNTGSLSWTAYTQPFTSELWASTAAILFLIVVTFFVVSHYYHISILALEGEGNVISKSKTVTKDRTLNITSKFVQYKRDALLLSCAAFTQQGWTYTPDTTGLRIVFWTAYVFGLMISASYSAKLVSFLTVTEHGLLFDSLEDLKALGNYRLGIQRGSVLEDLFKTPTFNVYWQSLIAPYEDTLPSKFDDLRASALASPKFAYIGSYEVQRLDSIGACTFRSARQHLLYNDGSLAWGKGFPYGPVFNHFINKMRESGLLYKIKQKWYPKPYSCPHSTVIALDLKKVFTAFILFVFGIGLSILILYVEKLYLHYTQKAKTINIKKTSMHP